MLRPDVYQVEVFPPVKLSCRGNLPCLLPVNRRNLGVDICRHVRWNVPKLLHPRGKHRDSIRILRIVRLWHKDYFHANPLPRPVAPRFFSELPKRGLSVGRAGNGERLGIGLHLKPRILLRILFRLLFGFFSGLFNGLTQFLHKTHESQFTRK